MHVQLHGPVPETGDAVFPLAQRFGAVGAVADETPLALPHWPAMTLVNALHDALDPPLVLSQFQYQGPAPIKPLIVPLLQRKVPGAVENVPRLDDPHAPFMGVTTYDPSKLINPPDISVFVSGAGVVYPDTLPQVIVYAPGAVAVD